MHRSADDINLRPGFVVKGAPGRPNGLESFMVPTRLSHQVRSNASFTSLQFSQRGKTLTGEPQWSVSSSRPGIAEPLMISKDEVAALTRGVASDKRIVAAQIAVKATQAAKIAQASQLREAATAISKKPGIAEKLIQSRQARKLAEKGLALQARITSKEKLSPAVIVKGVAKGVAKAVAKGLVSKTVAQEVAKEIAKSGPKGVAKAVAKGLVSKAAAPKIAEEVIKEVTKEQAKEAAGLGNWFGQTDVCDPRSANYDIDLCGSSLLD